MDQGAELADAGSDSINYVRDDKSLLARVRKAKRQAADSISPQEAFDHETCELLAFATGLHKYSPQAFEGSGFDSLNAYQYAVRQEAFSALEILIDHDPHDVSFWTKFYLPGYLAACLEHVSSPLVARAALRGILMYLGQFHATASPKSVDEVFQKFLDARLLDALFQIIARGCTDSVEEEQTEYATAIIAHICTTQTGRQACNASHILDALMSRMLQFYVASGHLSGFSVGNKFIISPARKPAQLGPVLAAIFSLLQEQWSPSRLYKVKFWQRIMAPQHSTDFRDNPVSTRKGTIDLLYDHIKTHPLASFVVWLYDIARAETGQCKVAAIQLLIRFRCMTEDLPANIEEWLMTAMIPILISDFKLEEGSQLRNISQYDSLHVDSAAVQTVRVVREVLELGYVEQAVSHGIIKKLMSALSATYNVSFDTRMHKWWSSDKSDFSKAGRNMYGVKRDRLRARIPCVQINVLRELILESLCYISDTDPAEENRKAIVALKQTGPIISCLRSSGEPETINSKKVNGEIYPNSNPVILMACHLVRLFGRSIAIARTTLFDYDLAPTLIHLLQSDDKDLEISAIVLIGNFFAEWNPHRAKLVELGASKMFYERAKSSDGRVRLASINGLKNLMWQCDVEQKRECLEQLGLSLLWRCLALEDATEGVSTTDNAESNTMEVEDELAVMGNVGAILSQIKNSSTARNSNNGPKRRYPSFARAHLARPRYVAGRSEKTISYRIRVATLRFLQNLLARDGKVECIAHIFEQNEFPFMDVLEDYLSGAMRLQSRAKTLKKTGELVEDLPLATLCVLSHIAGSSEKLHLVMEREKLLGMFANLLEHSLVSVRKQAVNLIANLTFMVDNDDEEKCKIRAETLKSHGVLDGLRNIVEFDDDLDARETAKRIVQQFEHVGVSTKSN